MDRYTPTSEGVRHTGDTWIRRAASVALSVPSAVVPLERNPLLNPAHLAFERLRAGEPTRFRFDDRLTGGEGIG